MAEIKSYEEYETERIDELIEELKKQKMKLRKEMREKEPKLTNEAIHQLNSSALATIVFRLLGGHGIKEVEARHFPSMHGDGGHVNFIFHHFYGFDDREMDLLSTISLYTGDAKDDHPAIEVDVHRCSIHLDCIEADISVFYSENDWEFLTKTPAKPKPKAKPKSK